MRRACVLLAATLCGGLVTSAVAQPPRVPDGDKDSAKALLQSGLKLFAAKDYLGALAVFKDAYQRFPSGKILLNIGTTLLKLDRPADAANAYQRYLDSPDADPAKKGEAVRVLADLDKKVGIIDVVVEPADAEVQIGSDDWKPASEVARVRVKPGAVTVRARRDAYQPAETTLTAKAAATIAATLQLEAEPVVVTTGAASASTVTNAGASSIGATFTPPARRSRFGALALAHIDPALPGAAGIVGVVADVTDRISVRAAAILGSRFGGYAGGSYAFLTSRVRPIIAVAVPVFRSEGFRWSVRGAGGVELAFHRNVSVIAELGVEHLFNPEASVAASTLFVPAVGVTGRL